MSHSSAPLPLANRFFYDRLFLTACASLGSIYVLLIVALVAADIGYVNPSDFARAFASENIRYATWLTLISCTLSAIISLWVAVPLAYLLSRFRFPLCRLVDALLDIPIVLPPLVIGLSLLMLFHLSWGGTNLESYLRERLGFPVTYAVPSVILAQFAVTCAFAVRAMRIAFDEISPRTEQVALTLGCTRCQAFWRVVMPQATPGVVTAFTVSWARALGEFGPILVFSGATRGRTEVLSTSIFLELSIGELGSAVAVSLGMVAVALMVLLALRLAANSRSLL